MIDEMVGNSIIVDSEWLKENDPEMLDWAFGKLRQVKLKYDGDWELTRDNIIVEMDFDEGGTRYYVCTEEADDADCPSRNASPVGEESWEDWGDIEILTAYYKEIKQG